MEIAEAGLLGAALMLRSGRFVRDPELSLRPVELGDLRTVFFKMVHGSPAYNWTIAAAVAAQSCPSGHTVHSDLRYAQVLARTVRRQSLNVMGHLPTLADEVNNS
jgi:metal-sulfur cluster biosynthetic enzyme